MDKGWRRRAAAETLVPPKGSALDICCGTGDLSLELARLEAAPTVVGIDVTGEMLTLGRRKIFLRGGEATVHLIQSDALELPFSGPAFDAVTVAFGLRNIPDRRAALREVRRVLRPGGRLVILEFSHPKGALLRRAYHLYLHTVPLFLSKLLRADSQAYRYLARSVVAFPRAEELAALLEEAGFRDVTFRRVFLGTVAIHIAVERRISRG